MSCLPALCRAAAAVLLFCAPTAFAQAIRWNVAVPEGFVLGAGAPTRFAGADSSGSLFLVGKRLSGGGSCFVTLKYGGSGSLAWTRESCTTQGEAVAMAVAVDAQGNAYVTGTVGTEFRTIKYRGSDGAVIWEKGWSGGAATTNVASAVAIDPSGYPYVVGTSNDGIRYRLSAIKYNPGNGDRIWETLQTGEGNYQVIGAGVTPNGNLLVGANIESANPPRPQVIEFSGAAGFAMWSALGRPGERMTAFTADPFGAAIAALRVVDPETFGDSILVRKYTNGGSGSWERPYASPGMDNPTAVATDAAGNVVVGVGLGGIYDLLRFTRDGQLLFESTYSREGQPAQANAVAFDEEGNILSTGFETAADGVFMRVAKQDSTQGTPRWQARVGTGGGTRQSGLAIIPAGASVFVISLETVTGPVEKPKLRVVNFSNTTSGTDVNVHGLWWNEAQSGWGVNLMQQGEKLFATWFAYDTDGQGMWLVMSDGVPSGTNAWSGQLHRTTGPAFNIFNPSSATQVSYALVGTATFTFNDANHGSMTTTVNGVARSQNLMRYQFGPLPSCGVGASPGNAPNYTDIWWRPIESGWGLALTHQGDTLFALWYTYAPDNRNMWLVGSKLDRVGDRLYSGILHRTTGTPFTTLNAWQLPSYQQVGSVTLNFTDANNAVMDYTVNGVTQSKPITRYVFATPVTVCR